MGLKTGEILSWAEVQQVHRIRNGVYQRGGRLISLLTDFGRHNPCYPDHFANAAANDVLTGDANSNARQPMENATLSATDKSSSIENALPAKMFYTGAGRRGDQGLSPANRALFAAIESRHAVPLFNKLEIGRWQFMGYWRVTTGAHVFDTAGKRMIWRFTLEQANVKP